MFKVFLGSTFKDLYEHRKAVLDAINRRDDCKAVVMEEFGARAGPPNAVCLEIAGACDLYVGLIGHCYGYVPDGETVSITEAEYAAAVEKGLPRLLFLANDGFTPPAHIRESDEQHRKLQEFRARLQRDETCQWFDNDKGTLAARVGDALNRELGKLSKRADMPAAMPVFLPKRGLCVGRDAEVAQVCRAVLAEEPEPVIVLGPPGIGKSKVTIAALHDPAVKARFGERRWFVQLETAPEPAAILGQVALAAGVRPGPDLAARLLVMFADGPGLLVLDNAETPWWRDAAGTEAVLEELAQVPALALVCSVRGQSAPHRPAWGTSLLVPSLPGAAAREVFLSRAGERHAASALLTSLLAELDGVPLAIDLLAGQVRQDELSLDRVAAAWQEKRTALLAARENARHRLDSYVVSLALSLDSERMTEAARTLYAMMGRLPAGITVDAAEALLPGNGPSALEILGSLGLAFDAGVRMRMLAPVRQHAAQRELAPEPLERLIAYWLGLAITHGLRAGGSEGSEAVAVLGAEWANLESLFQLALFADAEKAVKAALAVAQAVPMAGLGSDKMLLASETVARARNDLWSTARINGSLGDIALARSDLERAERHYEMALELFLQVGAAVGEANCIHRLGDIAFRRSNHAESHSRYETALLLYQREAHVLGQANCIKGLGDLSLARSEYDTARQYYAEALPLYRQIGAVLGEANCTQSLGDIVFRHSDHQQACRYYEAALSLNRRAGNIVGEASCLRGMGDILLARSDNRAAGARFEEALLLYRRVGDVSGQARCIFDLGSIAFRLSHYDVAKARYDMVRLFFSQIGAALDEANCLLRLGDIARQLSNFPEARNHYQGGLLLYRRADHLLGQANCISGLGDIALVGGDARLAYETFGEALTLYRRIDEPYSIGCTLVRLARLAEGIVRAERVAEARAAWESIDRPDLVAGLDREFGAGREG